MTTIKVKTAELEGYPLNWAVASCLNGQRVFFEAFGAKMLGRSITEEVLNGNIKPSTDWAQAGPLIEKYWHEIDTVLICEMGAAWPDFVSGNILLLVFCRAIVASRIGDELEIPEELLK